MAKRRKKKKPIDPALAVAIWMMGGIYVTAYLGHKWGPPPGR